MNGSGLSTRHLWRLPWLILTVILAGCESFAYYWQAASGHLSLMRQARPVREVLADEHTPEAIRRHLLAVQSARTFARDRMGLRVDDSYTTWVALDRPAVVWNLFVSPPNRLQLRTWCFPVAGCVGYRGYFDRMDAEMAARRFAEDDVWIGGASAYSTLGWFDDPVLSTMLGPAPLDTAALIFHELAHKTVWVKGDITLSESWATFVEQSGARAFAQDQGWLPELMAYQRRQAARAAFANLVGQLIEALEPLYAASTPEQARERREPLFRRFAQSLRDCADRHPALKPWARSWQTPLNNARLLTVRSYTRWVGALEVQFGRLHRNWPAMVAWFGELATRPEAQRQATLQELDAHASSSVLTNTLEFRCQL